ncbi:MAG: tRNA uridine-5-carboxymethylaminomethyl(34) synthesis GTPase MnmE [Proteobacteria bacterium]|nr:tRNA uridine-5-carboxymethylaminomethyl(34) synthesis GTPase MnmE [Pseudomonadota bacterium]
MSQPDTICALATPPGEGAVGIVRLSGPRATELLQRAACGRTLRPRRMVRVDLVDPATEARIDEVLACVMPAPRSFTGEDVVEIYGHGGQLNLEALLALFIGLGARPAGPGEFTRRAFLNGRLDLTQAEAVAEVIGARSTRALQNAQALLGGALGREVRSLRARAVELAAELEARIDFAEELEALQPGRALVEGHRELIAALGRLVASYRRGRRLNGVVVVLVGAVNAGKSSLFNRLLGSQRALVSAEPGTTRDYLEAEVEWDGLRVTLIDTAGEREGMSALERAGLALGLERARSADVVLQVVDVSAAGPEAVFGAPGGGVGRVVVANKIDRLAAGAAGSLRRPGRGNRARSRGRGFGRDGRRARGAARGRGGRGARSPLGRDARGRGRGAGRERRAPRRRGAPWAP